MKHNLSNFIKFFQQLFTICFWQFNIVSSMVPGKQGRVTLSVLLCITNFLDTSHVLHTMIIISLT